MTLLESLAVVTSHYYIRERILILKDVLTCLSVNKLIISSQLSQVIKPTPFTKFTGFFFIFHTLDAYPFQSNSCSISNVHYWHRSLTIHHRAIIWYIYVHTFGKYIYLYLYIRFVRKIPRPNTWVVSRKVLSESRWWIEKLSNLFPTIFFHSF